MTGARKRLGARRSILLFGAPLANCTLLGAPAAWAQEPPPSPATCEGRTELAPQEMATCLQMGQVDLQGVTITGSLDLSALGTIASPLRCVDCTVQGDVIAADVTFERLVTLERVVVEGDLDARGARFEGAVLARGRRGEDPTGIRGEADFSLARFEEALQLDATTFFGDVSFEGAHFAGAVSMSGTDMHGKVTFDRIVAAETFAMDGVDPFNPSLEAGRADAEVLFRNATFARDLELSGRSFNGGLVATGSRVQGRLAIRSAVIEGDARLDRVVVDDLDATGVEVRVRTQSGATCGQRVLSALGELDLSDLRAQSITLSQALVDELKLQGAQVTGRANLELDTLTCNASFDGFSAADLSIDFSAIDRAAPSARLTMLQTVAETAREAGDLDLANEATYRRFVELNRDDPFPKRTLDTVFLRGMTGYFVKPLRPLVCLLVLLLIGTAIRFVASGRQRAPGNVPPSDSPTETPDDTTVRVAEAAPANIRDFETALTPTPTDAPPAAPTSTGDRLGDALSETGWAIVRPGPTLATGSKIFTKANSGRLLEYSASKILLVILVIAISNNSTALDQIIDSLMP